ncbi:HAUS augmin-like complex subunit 7 [Gastrophryne carolinensis]
MAGSMELRKAAELWERLQKLSCCSLEGVYVSEPQSVHELLCTQSPLRLSILEWICTRIYPPLQEQFSSLKESEQEIKVKEMAKLVFELMLCRDEDVDLIKGNVASSKQLTLIENLLNILQSFPKVNSNPEPESSQGMEFDICAFEQQYNGVMPCPLCSDGASDTYSYENDELLNELFSSAHFQATLAPECNPWPADLQSLVLTEAPQERLMSNSSDDHFQELQKISSTLKELKDECMFLSSSVADGDTAIQTLRLAMTDFHQLMTTFIQVYDSEFQEHCNYPAPQLSPSGPLFHAVHSLLGNCSKELEAIAQFIDTSNTVADVVRNRQHSKESWGGSSTATLYEKIKELKQSYEMFLSSMQK